VEAYQLYRIRMLGEMRVENLPIFLTPFTAQSALDILTHATPNDGWEYRMKTINHAADIVDLHNFCENVKHMDSLKSVSMQLRDLNAEKNGLEATVVHLAEQQQKLIKDITKLRKTKEKFRK
jgi:hypothetical protein